MACRLLIIGAEGKYMKVELKYGHSTLILSIPDKASTTVLTPNAPPPLPDPVKAFEATLDAPAGGPRLEDRKEPRTVGIAIPDETRAVPVKLLLPVLLKKMMQAWPNLRPDDITIYVGTGLHAPMDMDSVRRMLPQECGFRVVIHDARNSAMKDFGVTSRGTPVRINADLGSAEFKAVIGNIDPHQFVGFTGGAKGIIVGCGSPQTIEHNHGLMFHELAQPGVLDGNPVREDLNEAGRMAGVDFAVNVNLDPEKRIVGLISGEPESVLRMGAKTCAAIYGVAYEEPFDVVVASCGGHPKDICLYQAQKGLNLASQALKPGGRILLTAACGQGIGDDVYYEYVKQFKTVHQALEHFKSQPFRMGAHKSFLFGRTLTRFEVVIASELDADTLRTCHLTKGEPQSVIDKWIEGIPGSPRVAVVPSANTTFLYRR